MSSESHDPPNERDRQVPPFPLPPDAVASEEGSGSRTVLRGPRQGSRKESPVSGPGTGSTLGFSTIKGRRVPFEGRPASPDHRAVDDPPTTGEDSITDSKALKLILRRFRA